MPNVEWDIPMRLETPGGTIFLNDPDPETGRIYRVLSDEYVIVPTIRVTQDNISQADGSVLHPRFLSGLVARFKVSYHVTRSGTDANEYVIEPACGEDLRVMHEELMGAIDSIKSLQGVQRYFWQPTGYGDERMIDEIQILEWPSPSYDLDGLEVSVTFSVETPFPYAIDSTEIDPPTIAAGADEVLANLGNAPVSPVFLLHGPVTTPTAIQNLTTGFNIVYDPTRPGAVNIPMGHYAEIDTFRGTVFEDGSGNDLIAGIDPTMTDFFTLDPGDNDIGLDGPTGSLDAKYNNGWA